MARIGGPFEQAAGRNAGVQGHCSTPILAGPLAARYTDGMDAPEKRRWNCPTPGWLVLGSLAATGLIWLSNWLGWPAWHKGYAVLAAVAGVGVVLAVMLLWWLVALVFRWRFQFSIRSLLVLTLAVALPCSWFAVEASEEHDAIAIIKKSNDAEFGTESILPVGIRESLQPASCGFFDRVVEVSLDDRFRTSREDQTDELVRALRKLRYLKVVVISGRSWEVLDGRTRLDEDRIKAAIPGVAVLYWMD